VGVWGGGGGGGGGGGLGGGLGGGVLICGAHGDNLDWEAFAKRTWLILSQL